MKSTDSASFSSKFRGYSCPIPVSTEYLHSRPLTTFSKSTPLCLLSCEYVHIMSFSAISRLSQHRRSGSYTWDDHGTARPKPLCRTEDHSRLVWLGLSPPR